MAMIPQSTTDAIEAINTATSALGVVVGDLRARVKTGMSQADVDEVNGKLGEISTALTSMASDPDNLPPPVQPLRAKS